MNYPIGVKSKYTKKISYENRGMNLEDDINETNIYYLVNGIASIYKKPTPIKIVNVDYPGRNKAVIREAYFVTPSTTDYNGIYKGRYIDFEAKETGNMNFPIQNIHKHQVDHLKRVVDMGGIGFIIVRFSKLNKTLYLEASKLFEYIEDATRKSIPYDYFLENGYLIDTKYNPRLDYLKIINELYFKEAKKWKESLILKIY